RPPGAGLPGRRAEPATHLRQGRLSRAARPGAGRPAGRRPAPAHRRTEVLGGADPMIAILRALALLVLVAVLAAAPGVGPWPGDRPALAQEQVPGGALGDTSDADFWRAIRQGESFSTTLPDPKAATLIQSEGDNWRAIRNGPLSTYGAWALLGILA